MYKPNFLQGKKRKKTEKKKFSLRVSDVLLAFFAIIILGFGFFFYLAGGSQNKQSSNSAVKRGHVMSRTKKPGIVKDVVMTTDVNPNNGKPFNNKAVFSKSNTVYADIRLNNASKGMHIEYVRYYNGKYLDHGSIQLSQNNSDYANFNWQRTNKKATDAKGTYLLKIYANGRLETTTHYSIS